MAMRLGWLDRVRMLGHWTLGALIAGAIGLGSSAATAQTRAAEARTGGQLINTFVPTNVREMGQGPAIVLIHGLTAAMDWWDPIVAALAQNYRVITVDLLGHGGTEAPETGYEIENQAALVYGAMTQLGVTSATVVGHSLGGQVATAIAEQYPEAVERLIIMNTPAAEVGGDRGQRILDMPLVGQMLAEVVTDEMLRTFAGTMFAPGFVVPDAYVADARQLTFSVLQQAQAAGEAYRSALPIHLRISRLAAQPPVLVILTELDAIVLPTDAALYATIPNIRVEVIPGVGHSPMIEAPALTIERMTAFITETTVTAEVVPAAPAVEAFPLAPVVPVMAVPPAP